MAYKTRRPSLRKLLTFGAGATLAMAQLGAGCAPSGSEGRACDADAAVDDAGNCVDSKPKDDGGGDAK